MNHYLHNQKRLIMFHLVIEDSEGNRQKITDFPKDVEDILIDFVADMEN